MQAQAFVVGDEDGLMGVRWYENEDRGQVWWDGRQAGRMEPCNCILLVDYQGSKGMQAWSGNGLVEHCRLRRALTLIMQCGGYARPSEAGACVVRLD